MAGLHPTSLQSEDCARASAMLNFSDIYVSFLHFPHLSMISKTYSSFFPFGPSVFRPNMPSADFSEVTKLPLDNSCLFQDTPEISLGKDDRLHCTTVRSTLQPLDRCGLCDVTLTRPDCLASYLIPVRQLATLLHASFRPYLTVTPLRFANPSAPSAWVRDFHPQAIIHARHT